MRIQQDEQSRRVKTDGKALARVFIEAFPVMAASDQRLALTLYRLLAKGRAVSPEDLASALARPVENIQRTLGQWPGVFYDDRGRVVGFCGLSVEEMKHCLEVNGTIVYAWCAWDTLFLPALIGASAAVFSRCAQTDEPIRLTVSPERIDSLEAASVVISFLEPDERELRENVSASFCHFVHFFRDREAGSRWTARHPGTFLLTLDEAFEIGQRVNVTRYRDVLQPLGVIRT